MKNLVLVIAVFCVFSVEAQNIQLHYDFGRFMYDDLAGRPLLTSTVEMFKSDKWGSTFFFVDMDYKSGGVDAAYWEISREIRLCKSSFSAHVEYNGGLNYVRNAYLTGLTYTYNNKTFSNGFSLSAMYKYIQKQDMNEPHNFQVTGTWYMNFGAFTFSGFADFWREKSVVGDYIFLSEPQLWLLIKRFDEGCKLSIGSEVELSYDFAVRDGFYAIPTAALKWDF